MVGLFVKVPLSSPPWLGMNCTWTVVKMPGRFATWPCIMILFYDPGRPLLIYQNSDLFGSINFLGSTRWLAHQIPAPARATGTNAGTKNTEGWRNHKIYCHSMTDFNEVIENVWKQNQKEKKESKESDSTKQKLRCYGHGIKMDRLNMVDSIVTCQTIPPTSDETPVTLSPHSANRLMGGSILKLRCA